MEKIYIQLLNEIYRLKGKISDKELHDTLDEFIYQRLSIADFAKIAGSDYKSSITLPGGLMKEPILRLVLQMIRLLQSVSTWDDFEKLINLGEFVSQRRP